MELRLSELVTGLDAPLYLTHAGDGSGLLYVVEQAGRILVVEEDGRVRPEPFLDIRDRVTSGGEQGLLSVAFHPDYGENRRFFVDYTDRNGDTVIAEYRARGGVGDPGSERILLHIDQPFANHNGGLVLFGPDGYLYVGMGDGGSGGDPMNNGQRTDTLLGKLLRIDVDGGRPYAVPSTNPFVGVEGARPEIWAYGLRNPWRFSFDREAGDLFIADVGQDAFEEIDVEPAGTPGGLNYGWRIMEGLHCFETDPCDHTGLVLPVAEYTHEFGCSITGGYVYRGTRHPALFGAYLFADFCSGRVWALSAERALSGQAPVRQLVDTDLNIASFGQDEEGELYVVDLGGGVYRVEASER